MPQFAKLLLEVLHCESGRRPGPAIFVDFTPADWAAFTLDAIHYRFAFQVNEYLRADSARLALVPEPCLQQLKDSIRYTSVFNLVQQHHLRKMLVACKQRNIPVMLVKGLWLVELVYRDTGARSSGDIDIVIKPKDMLAFTLLAKELGFEVPANVDNICDLAATKNEFKLRHLTDGSCFDLHWLLAHPLRDGPVDEEALWRRSEEVFLAGVPCRSLRLEDHLLYICLHAAMQHRFWLGPRALLDIAKLIERPPRPIDWNDVVFRAHQMGWQRSAWSMFDLVREHLGVMPPAPVLLGLQPSDGIEACRRLREAAMGAMLQSQQQDDLPRNLVRLVDQPLLGKIALLARLLFPSRRELACQFVVTTNTPGVIWLYLRRWRGLVKNNLPLLFRLALGTRMVRTDLERSRLIEHWLGSSAGAPIPRASSPQPEPSKVASLEQA